MCYRLFDNEIDFFFAVTLNKSMRLITDHRLPLSLFSSLLVSMAPLSHEIRPVTSCCPPHFGPAVPEVNSVWFKLFIYDQVKSGPPSLLLVKGTRLRWLPKIFEVTAVFEQKIYLGLQKAVRDFVPLSF